MLSAVTHPNGTPALIARLINAKRQLRLGRESGVLRHVGGPHPCWIAGPGFRQVELSVNEGMALVGGVSGKHPDLADRMFVAGGGGSSPLWDERGLFRMGRRRASRTRDEPCRREAKCLSVWIPPS